MRIKFVTLVLVWLLPFAARAEQPAFAPAQVEALEKIIHDTIVGHPEILMEAAQALQKKEETAHTANSRATIAKLRPELERDSNTPVLGNPDGDVTVVEFFDFNCGYCKVVFPVMMKAVAADGKVRLVLKDLPILGPDSLTASKTALAAHAQGKYRAFLTEAMGRRGKLDDNALAEISKSIGLDPERLKKDMSASDIEKTLDKNHELALALDINGTPAFIVGDTLTAGALNEKTLKELIARTRKTTH